MKKRTWNQKLKQRLFEEWKKAACVCTKVRETPSFKNWTWVGILLIKLLLETILSDAAHQFIMVVVEILKPLFELLFRHWKL